MPGTVLSRGDAVQWTRQLDVPAFVEFYFNMYACQQWEWGGGRHVP